MTPRLPPLNALRAFEAAARHLSFTKAAAELHVTQAAISHQIKTLEEHLGVSLFQRRNKAVLLTEAGQLCLPGVRDGFARAGLRRNKQVAVGSCVREHGGLDRRRRIVVALRQGSGERRTCGQECHGMADPGWCLPTEH